MLFDQVTELLRFNRPEAYVAQVSRQVQPEQVASRPTPNLSSSNKGIQKFDFRHGESFRLDYGQCDLVRRFQEAFFFKAVPCVLLDVPEALSLHPRDAQSVGSLQNLPHIRWSIVKLAQVNLAFGLQVRYSELACCFVGIKRLLLISERHRVCVQEAEIEKIPFLSTGKRTS